MLYTAEIVQSFIDNDKNLVDHFSELQNKEGNEKYWAEHSFKGLLESIIQESINEEIGLVSSFYPSNAEELLPSLKRLFTWKESYSVEVEEEIIHFTAQEGDHNKMGMIERFNRTMKALLSKYFVAYNTKGKWIDALPDIVHNYNHTFHRGIQCTPVEAEQSTQIRKEIREAASFKTSLLDYRKSLHVGDKVRVLRNRVLFEKEGPKWSRQVYEIEVDDITSFQLKGQDREYKHYELLKVGEVQKNPFARVATSHDVEQNLEAARKNLKGARPSAERRPSTRFEEFARKDVAPKKWSRGPSSSQKEQVEQLKKSW